MTKVKYAEYVFVGLISLVILASIYFYSWTLSRFDRDSAMLSLETLRLQDDLTQLSRAIDASSLEGKSCRTAIAIWLYELKKDTVRNSHRNITLFSNLAHTNALFLTILFMVILGLVFSIFQMATASRDSIAIHSQIEIEAANIKVRTGYVSIAVSVIALIALSFYLSEAHEVKELTGATESVLDIDLTAFIEGCRDFRVPN